MTTVAVIAHSKKQLGAGLPELRRKLEAAGFPDPIWHEVQKSKQAPDRVRKALTSGADLIFVWGGDGTVQRCIDVLGDHPTVTLAILPAGTANLLATNLGIEADLATAVDVGLHGDRRSIDVGVINGERFAVMAGCGFDALMIRDADRGLKDRWGRVAYIWTGAKHLRSGVVKGKIRVDGKTWYKGRMSCVLVGNVGSVLGNLHVFDDARPDDGRLDVGVVTADGFLDWTRAFGRIVFGRADRSPFVQTTVARKIDVRLDSKTPYELDGGDRPPTRRIKVKVQPGAITVAVPSAVPS